MTESRYQRVAREQRERQAAREARRKAELKAARKRHSLYRVARLIPRRMAIAAGANSSDQIAAALDQCCAQGLSAGRSYQDGNVTRGCLCDEAHRLPDRSFLLKKE